VRVWASFRNTGEETFVQGGDPLFKFQITDDENHHSKPELTGLALQSYTFKPGDEIFRHLVLYNLGFYGLEKYIEPYPDLTLPKGTYTIGAQTSIRTDSDSEFAPLETRIMIQVE